MYKEILILSLSLPVLTIIYVKFSKKSYLKKLTRLESINLEINEKQHRLSIISNLMAELREEYNRRYLKFDKAKSVLSSLVTGMTTGYFYTNDENSDFVSLAIKNASKSFSKTILNKLRSAS